MAIDLTYEERLEQLDREVSALQHMFIEAVEEVRRAPETDDSFDARWIETAERLKNLRGAIRPEDYDKSQFATLATAMLDIRDQLERLDHEENVKLDVCDNLMILLERVRHVVRDALDEHVTGVADDVGLVMHDLDEWLPNTPDRTIADLLEVDRRTLSRWARTGGRATSEPAHLHALGGDPPAQLGRAGNSHVVRPATPRSRRSPSRDRPARPQLRGRVDQRRARR
jgi:hypothetical protein